MTAILIHPHLLFSPRTWSAFPAWYLWGKPKRIIATTLAYMFAAAEICSLLFLLRTMFAPWKSITETYAVRGMQPGLLLQALTLNVTSRLIGAFIRLCAIVLGIIIELAIVGIGIAALFVWFAFPLWCVWLLFF